jgi:glutathione S-transferase
MITVYGAPPTRALRVIWMLEEMGLDYRVRPVDMRTRRQDAEFMAASPAGAAPGLADGQVAMMESVAILEYLGARHGPTPLVVTPDEPDFPLYLQYLHYGEASLASQINVVIASRFFAPEGE